MIDNKPFRDYSLDWLKTIGTLCLFLAHVEAPFWLKELRSFDVPLMVFVSGLLTVDSYLRSSSDTYYIFKRIKRLVIPTWLFLCFFYICMFAVGKLPDSITIIKSFLFQRDGGIAGYTWIIWVYIVCGVLTPYLVKTRLNYLSIVIISAVGIAFELVTAFSNLSDIRILYYSFFTLIPYGVVLFFSIKYKEASSDLKKYVLTFLIVLHCVYTLVLYYSRGEYISVNEYKYPARIYYFSYGIPIAIILLNFFRSKYFLNRRFRLVEFISKHSLWIYLWHILVIAVLKYVLKIDNWMISYVLLVTLSIGITFLQNLLIEKIQKNHHYSFLKYFVG